MLILQHHLRAANYATIFNVFYTPAGNRVDTCDSVGLRMLILQHHLRAANYATSRLHKGVSPVCTVGHQVRAAAAERHNGVRSLALVVVHMLIY